MTREQLLDLYFIEARAKLIDLAAFLDRAQRAEDGEDFRLAAFRKALGELQNSEPSRARRVLLALSDLTTEPVPAASGKGACGAPASTDSEPSTLN